MNPTELVLLTDTTKQKPSRKYHHEIHVFATNIANFHIFLGREQGSSLFYIPEFKRPWRRNVFSSSFCFVVEIFGKWVGCCHPLETIVIHVVQSLWMSMYNVPHKINFEVVLQFKWWSILRWFNCCDKSGYLHVYSNSPLCKFCIFHLFFFFNFQLL